MTILFQILAILAIIAAALFMLRGGGARHQAVRRIFLLLFIVAAGSSVVFPQLWTFAASFLGVGRGADLLLYITVLAFLGFIATTYRKFRSIEKDVTELARRVALMTAQEPSDPPPPAT